MRVPVSPHSCQHLVLSVLWIFEALDDLRQVTKPLCLGFLICETRETVAPPLLGFHED